MSTDESLAHLLAENARLREELSTPPALPAPQNGNKAKLYVGAVVGLSVLAVAAVLTIFAMRPDKDNTGLIATVLAFLVPLVTAFLGAAVREVGVAVDGRLTQLLALSNAAQRAKGQAEGAATEKHAARVERVETADARAKVVAAAEAKKP